ncbi:MAG: flagellar basal body-associated protein FliL, partial [Alphaproteobacteria bacterium HGW-Alphaproteobacteria-2]
MRRLLPFLLALVGLVGGTAGGYFLRPALEPSDEATAGERADAAHPKEEAGEFVRLNNQFIVPLVEGERVAGMVVLTLSIEVAPGASDRVFANEPR